MLPCFFEAFWLNVAEMECTIFLRLMPHDLTSSSKRSFSRASVQEQPARTLIQTHHSTMLVGALAFAALALAMPRTTAHNLREKAVAHSRGDSCSVPDSGKTDCGYVGVDQQQCEVSALPMPTNHHTRFPTRPFSVRAVITHMKYT
jgi:hypothetical protein